MLEAVPLRTAAHSGRGGVLSSDWNPGNACMRRSSVAFGSELVPCCGPHVLPNGMIPLKAYYDADPTTTSSSQAVNSMDHWVNTRGLYPPSPIFLGDLESWFFTPPSPSPLEAANSIVPKRRCMTSYYFTPRAAVPADSTQPVHARLALSAAAQ